MTIEFYARTEGGWVVRPNFEVMQFPGGEWHIKNHDTVEYKKHYAVMHGAAADDLVILALWADMIPDGYREVFVPYLPAARSDRKEGDNPIGADVYSQLLDTAMRGYKPITIDPHSEAAEGHYYYPRKLDAAKVAVRAIAGRSGLSPYAAVIAPDKGAHERAKAVGDLLGVPTLYATKTRDPETGKLSNFQAPSWGQEGAKIADGRYLVVDDICDGGGTFMGLASVLEIPRERLDLWVTHGVFSGNAGQLTEAYGNIYTTDSHPGASNPAVGARITPLLPWFFEEAK